MVRASALLWTIVVTLLTLMPGKDLPHVPIVSFDKIAHLGAFGLMAWLYLRWRPDRAALVTAASASYGALIEVLQGALTADRIADPWDAAANALGCVIALSLWKLRTFNRNS